jgi:hypothetical protein
MSATAASIRHPVRDRRAPSNFAQLFGVFGGPVAWNAQIVSSFALTSHPCFEHRAARETALQGWESISRWVLAINVSAIVVTALALVVAIIVWRWGRNQEAHTGPAPRLVTRTWAMGVAGVLSSGILLLAAIFALVASLGTPVCSS